MILEIVSDIERKNWRLLTQITTNCEEKDYRNIGFHANLYFLAENWKRGH
jgi:hypothetical protein